MKKIFVLQFEFCSVWVKKSHIWKLIQLSELFICSIIIFKIPEVFIFSYHHPSINQSSNPTLKFLFYFSSKYVRNLFIAVRFWLPSYDASERSMCNSQWPFYRFNEYVLFLVHPMRYYHLALANKSKIWTVTVNKHTVHHLDCIIITRVRIVCLWRFDLLSVIFYHPYY